MASDPSAPPAFRLAAVARSARTGVFSATFAGDLAAVDASLAITFRPECGRADAIHVALDQVQSPEHEHLEPALSAWVHVHEAEVVEAVLGVIVRPRLTVLLRRDDLTIDVEPFALSNGLELLAIISRATRAEPEVVLLREMDRDDDVLVQALALVERTRDGELVTYAYVPLSFGPVQETSSELTSCLELVRCDRKADR